MGHAQVKVIRVITRIVDIASTRHSSDSEGWCFFEDFVDGSGFPVFPIDVQFNRRVEDLSEVPELSPRQPDSSRKRAVEPVWQLEDSQLESGKQMLQEIKSEGDEFA